MSVFLLYPLLANFTQRHAVATVFVRLRHCVDASRGSGPMRRVAGVDDTIPLDVEGACISVGLAIAIARRHVHLCVFIGLRY